MKSISAIELAATLFQNDGIVFGILMLTIGLIFWSTGSNIPLFRKIYSVVPPVFLCYFIPSLLNTFSIISSEESELYFLVSRFLLPCSLVWLTLGTDLKELWNLGPKALIMFFTGTFGIIIGGPLSIMFFSLVLPELVGGTGSDAVWRGMTTIAGSWIGGGANQTAMYEIFGASADLFSLMVTIDIVAANFWLAFLLYGVGRSDKIDKYLKADASAIESLKNKMIAQGRVKISPPSMRVFAVIFAIGFSVTGFSHWFSDAITPVMERHAEFLYRYNLHSLTSGFFWLVIGATTAGLLLSLTKLRKYDDQGATSLGSLFIYILIATIGMQMDFMTIFRNPLFVLVAVFWISVHIILMISVAKMIRAPYFFIAVGSQANIGGAATAPIVASAFHPKLTSVGVVLAVFGYAVGTYGAILCGILMQTVAE